ncbi:hydrogenase expression/formation protein HypE [Roseospirillum parvum]|uniref:Hydrogenase expression/formation protein HypE n=2 Tax=Roseospirillum parvum TaxID=83401 RepID=A0A1G8B257_9PROT|nr:hydrogenase expression/formation protein HypE [Roseospirillum parvum]
MAATMTPHGPPLDLTHGRVEMSHGAGGRAMAQLIDQLFAAAFANPLLAQGNDQAVFTPPPGRLALATDTYVIRPRRFPGGDIGSLAVHGTVNDLAMGGAEPLYLTAGFVLEEGLPLGELAAIVKSMAAAASAAGVAIVTGDTKVVEHGHGDGVYINTAGLGVIRDPGLDLSGANARPGDAVLVSGTLGDHGMAVMAEREGLAFDPPLLSDSAPLGGLVAALLAAVPETRTLRDPTRGGLAATLNELAAQSGVGMVLEEAALPIRPGVRGACELLGIEPVNVANEGKLVAIVPAARAEAALAALKAHPLGREAALIGHVTDDAARRVEMVTTLGGRRVIDWLAGEQLPRIC